MSLRIPITMGKKITSNIILIEIYFYMIVHITIIEMKMFLLYITRKFPNNQPLSSNSQLVLKFNDPCQWSYRTYYIINFISEDDVPRFPWNKIPFFRSTKPPWPRGAIKGDIYFSSKKCPIAYIWENFSFALELWIWIKFC